MFRSLSEDEAAANSIMYPCSDGHVMCAATLSPCPAEHGDVTWASIIEVPPSHNCDPASSTSPESPCVSCGTLLAVGTSKGQLILYEVLGEFK